MNFSNKHIKQIKGLMIFAALLILAIIYSEVVFTGVVFFIQIARPFLYGGIVAFVLNIPMGLLEDKLLRKWKGKVAAKLKRPISLLVSMVLLILVVILMISLILPQIVNAIAILGQKIPPFFEYITNELVALSKRYPELQNPVSMIQGIQINWDAIVDNAVGFLRSGFGSMLTSTVSFASSIFGGLVNAVIAIIFAIYILSQKEKLADQGTRIIQAYLPQKVTENIQKILKLLYHNFYKFITGQCLEAIILGAMFIIAMLIFRMPYAVMVGTLIAFTALIPVVGAFIGCFVGAFLILIENPLLAFWFVIMFLIIQQIEGNLIYPKVVGSSVGLPSIWVLVAVSLGGSLLGVAGILFFIPLFATGYALLRENVNKRNAAIKNM